MKSFFVTLISLFTSIALAQSPASGERAEFDSAVQCTQSKVRPHLSQFISQAQPVVDELKNYLSQYRSICPEGAQPSREEIQPVVDSLQSLSGLFSQYRETYESNEGIRLSRSELGDLLVSDPLSLEDLYHGRAIHWDYKWGLSDESRQLMVRMFREKQSEAKETWKALDSVYAKLFYHNEFNRLDIDLLVKVLRIIPSDLRCLGVSDIFLTTVETRVIPNWERVIEAANSPVIVGEFDETVQCD